MLRVTLLLVFVFLSRFLNAAERVFFLGGDSVRYGYENGVISRLVGPGVRGVIGAADALDTRATLQNVDKWLSWVHHYEVIHFNCGLWDIRRGLTPSGTYVPIEEYRQNLEKITIKFKQTGARVIFATTTPVVPPANFNRQPADVIEYNKVAVEIMSRLGVEVNDLYAIARTNEMHADGVHFRDSMNREFAAEVVKRITGFPKLEVLSKEEGFVVDAWPACSFIVQQSADLTNWTSSEMIQTQGVYRNVFRFDPNARFVRTQVVW